MTSYKLFEGIEPGLRFPGGCDHCEAVQVLAEDAVHEWLIHLLVFHAEGCRYIRS